MSPADVANEALSMLGQSPIGNLDDGGTNSNRCRIVYANVVDFVLRAHRWRCAKFFSVLAETTVPAFKWSHAYRLPNGESEPYCLRVWEVNLCPTLDWTTGGNRLLLTNDSTAKIEYTGRVEDPNLWDAMLYQVIVTMLASKLCVPLRHDPKESQGLYAVAMDMLKDASGVDSQEGSMEVFESPDLIFARGG